jgi:hypothetical protein
MNHHVQSQVIKVVISPEQAGRSGALVVCLDFNAGSPSDPGDQRH